MFITGLGRGDLKVIGATTSDEYEKYILRDKAFARRFQRIDIQEPDQDMTTKIVVGVIPRIEHATGIKMAYTPFIREKLARFVVELTSEYNRVYETAGRYPDVINKYLVVFDQKFKDLLDDEKRDHTGLNPVGDSSSYTPNNIFTDKFVNNDSNYSGDRS